MDVNKIDILKKELEEAKQNKFYWENTVAESEYKFEMDKEQLELAELTMRTFEEAIQKLSE